MCNLAHDANVVAGVHLHRSLAFRFVAVQVRCVLIVAGSEQLQGHLLGYGNFRVLHAF